MSTKNGIGLGRDACQELSSALLTNRGKKFSAELSGADRGIGKISVHLTIRVLLEVGELLWGEFGLRFTHCGDGGRRQGALQREKPNTGDRY